MTLESIPTAPSGFTPEVTRTDTFDAPPNNYLICDRTGFKVPVSEGLKEEWNGAMVRKESWEPRHPQDFVRARPEHEEPSPRPEADWTYIDPTNGVTVDDLG